MQPPTVSRPRQHLRGKIEAADQIAATAEVPPALSFRETGSISRLCDS